MIAENRLNSACSPLLFGNGMTQITRTEDAKRELFLLDQVYELMYQVTKK